jgi:hypothetical protein
MNTFKSSDIGIIYSLDHNVIHPTNKYQLQFSFSCDKSLIDAAFWIRNLFFLEFRTKLHHSEPGRLL